MTRAEETCDDLDAAIFSGDLFHDEDALNTLRSYLKRWNKEAEVIADMLKDRESNSDS